MTLQEIKKKISSLKKIKRKLRPGTVERNNINKMLRKLKEEHEIKFTCDPDKQEIIDELIKLYRQKKKEIVVDFRDYTVDELKFHLNRVKEGGKNEKPYSRRNA